MAGHSSQEQKNLAARPRKIKSRSPPLESPHPRKRRSSVSPKRLKESPKSEHLLLESENERWKKWMKKAETDLEELRQNAEKYENLFRRQKELCDARTEELVLLETKYMKLDKHCVSQEEMLTHMRLQQEKLNQELQEKKDLLTATNTELRVVRLKADELSQRIPEMEKQLQNVEDTRRSELENLRSLQCSFEASERHFASVLEQVRSLIQENETAYQANCKLTKEKLAVDKELTLRMQLSSAMAGQLAEAHEEMKQINTNLKSLQTEKDRLFKKLKEQRSQISALEEELQVRDRALQLAQKDKSELEGQLKLANLCLSRALSDKNKADIFPQKTESENTESSERLCFPLSPNSSSQGQVRPLRDDSSAKDDTIMRLIEEINKLEEELQNCRMDLLKEQEINRVNQDCFKDLLSEPKNLEKEIQCRDRVIDSMKVTIEKVIAQRNRLGLQCVRKKEQIGLLKEKNRVLEDIMLIGNRLYDEGLKKIQDMKMANEERSRPTVSLLMQKVEDIEFTNEASFSSKDRPRELLDHEERPSTSEPNLKSPRNSSPLSTLMGSLSPRTTAQSQRQFQLATITGQFSLVQGKKSWNSSFVGSPFFLDTQSVGDRVSL